MPQLSPNILASAKRMRSDGVPWKKIGYELGVGEYKIRAVLEPGYRQRCADKVKRMRNGFAPRPARLPRVKKSALPRPQHMGAPAPHPSGIHAVSMRVPGDVLADRDRRAMIEPASLTAALQGDPLPGRSALDQRKPRLVVSNPSPYSIQTNRNSKCL